MMFCLGWQPVLNRTNTPLFGSMFRYNVLFGVLLQVWMGLYFFKYMARQQVDIYIIL
jgi:hypothetical protein